MQYRPLKCIDRYSLETRDDAGVNPQTKTMYPTKQHRLVSFLALVALIANLSPRTVIAQQRFSLEEVLAPGYPFALVSAKQSDRIAWLVFEQGRRNVYTAAAPDFIPLRLTSFLEDDGVDLTDLRISDDGKVLVFVRGHKPNRDGWVANPMSDPRGGERAIWAVRSDGGDAWKVVVASGPILAGDGSMVLFTRGGQIHGVAVDPRKPASESTGARPLFSTYGRNSDPIWSPDSKRIAFSSKRSGHSYIGLYEVDAVRVSYMAPGVDRDTSPTWSPDGSQIAFIRKPGPSFGEQAGGRGRGSDQRKGLRRAAFVGGYTFSLWVGDVASGKAREFWHTSPDEKTWTKIRRIRWAADHLLFEMEPGNWQNHYAIAADGSSPEPIVLTPGKGLAENSGLSSDGRHLFYSSNAGDLDRRHIWRTPTRGGESTQITLGDEIETYPAVLASGKQLAVLSATATRPLSVAIVSADGGTPRVIFPTFAAKFPTDDQVVPENVMLRAADGLRFHTQVFMPRDIRPGQRRPAVLFTHGGPRRQMLLGYHYRQFYHMAYAVNQYLASKGYIVISVNYRRGIGYGKKFRNAPSGRQRGNSEYKDVLAAGRYLQGRADVDPKRIGLWGLSFGGLLTAQGLARNSDIFSAGVDIAGVHLLGKSLDPDDTSYKASSISAIEGWKSPVLLIHGDDDRNVPFWQTASLVQLLRAHGVYHELIVYPDDVHSSLLYRRWLKSFNAMDDFFDRFLSAGD